MTETIFGKNQFDVNFEILLQLMSHLLKCVCVQGGVKTYTAASHERAFEMLRLHSGAPMMSILILQSVVHAVCMIVFHKHT